MFGQPLIISLWPSFCNAQRHFKLSFCSHCGSVSNQKEIWYRGMDSVRSLHSCLQTWSQVFSDFQVPTQKRINKSILIFSLPIHCIITVSFLKVLCFGCVNLTSFACHVIQEMSFAKLLWKLLLYISLCRWMFCGGRSLDKFIQMAWDSGPIWRTAWTLWWCLELLDWWWLWLLWGLAGHLDTPSPSSHLLSCWPLFCMLRYY